VSEVWLWLALFGLGAFHGINPGMGWLFAVALRLQEQRRSAVWNALPPIAIGHALSVGLVVALIAAIHASIPQQALRWSAAAVLIGFGIYRLIRARHPDGWECGLAFTISSCGHFSWHRRTALA
jgi:threonine/homoserine/homoserine lactone efflux protein